MKYINEPVNNFLIDSCHFIVCLFVVISPFIPLLQTIGNIFSTQKKKYQKGCKYWNRKKIKRKNK